MQFNFGDEREVYLLNESALPVTEKESKPKGKRSIGPRMKYGHENLNSFCAHTNKRVCVINLSSLSLCTCPSHKCVSNIVITLVIICLVVALNIYLYPSVSDFANQSRLELKTLNLKKIVFFSGQS